MHTVSVVPLFSSPKVTFCACSQDHFPPLSPDTQLSDKSVRTRQVHGPRGTENIPNTLISFLLVLIDHYLGAFEQCFCFSWKCIFLSLILFCLFLIFNSYFKGGYLHVPVAPSPWWADVGKVLVFFFFPILISQSTSQHTLYMSHACKVQRLKRSFCRQHYLHISILGVQHAWLAF